MSRRGLILLHIFLTIHCIFPQVSADRAAYSDAGGNRSNVVRDTKTSELQTTSNNDDGHDNPRSIIVRIIMAPLVLFWRLLIRGPMSMIGNMMTAMQQLLMNAASRMVSDMSEAALVEGWWLTKNFMLPGLDEFSMNLARQRVLPEGLNTAIMSAHSMYGMLKVLGFL